MRRLYFISIVLSLFIGNAWAKKDTLNTSRGFKEGTCYEEIAMVSCRPSSTCRLLVFPQSAGQLSFIIEKKIDGLAKDDLYLKTRFKVTTPDASKAQIMAIQKIHPADALKEMQTVSLLAKPISCQ